MSVSMLPNDSLVFVKDVEALDEPHLAIVQGSRSFPKFPLKIARHLSACGVTMSAENGTLSTPLGTP